MVAYSKTITEYIKKFFLPISGNIASILVLTNKDIDLKPSFVNILICLVKYYTFKKTFTFIIISFS